MYFCAAVVSGVSGEMWAYQMHELHYASGERQGRSMKCIRCSRCMLWHLRLGLSVKHKILTSSAIEDTMANSSESDPVEPKNSVPTHHQHTFYKIQLVAVAVAAYRKLYGQPRTAHNDPHMHSHATIRLAPLFPFLFIFCLFSNKKLHLYASLQACMPFLHMSSVHPTPRIVLSVGWFVRPYLHLSIQISPNPL